LSLAVFDDARLSLVTNNFKTNIPTLYEVRLNLMTPAQQQRLAIAVGFLAGLLASLHVLRDCKVWWPPDAVWEVLQGPQRLELGGGMALIVVTLVIWIVRQHET
jgi:hypothetical protein